MQLQDTVTVVTGAGSGVGAALAAQRVADEIGGTTAVIHEAVTGPVDRMLTEPVLRISVHLRGIR
ncbi:hypothetical protein SAMN05660657_05427 [Geodermatophilus amargosae]|uniref:Short chain dehydrogenase n=1 Tax=Geodermatophilus amargosae TaxID=1296565 RepID=A0A1I7D7F9_9ACTN|nr:hypothetical protein [Geodermatophilus amargosae]SFU07673.1 hypothetical protein SAMN05660657_05427 [Geodermatophilus amargosae]